MKVIGTSGAPMPGNQHKFLMLVQTLAQGLTHHYGRGPYEGAQVLRDAAAVPASVLPVTPEELYQWASELVEWDMGLGRREVPEWVDRAWWTGKDY